MPAHNGGGPLVERLDAIVGARVGLAADSYNYWKRCGSRASGRWVSAAMRGWMTSSGASNQMVTP